MLFLALSVFLLTFPPIFSTKIRARRATTLDPFFYDDEPLSFMKKSTTRDPIFEDDAKNGMVETKWTTSSPSTTEFSWFSTHAPTFGVTEAPTTVGQPKTTTWKSFSVSETQTHSPVFDLKTTSKPFWKSFFGSALENEAAGPAEQPIYGVETTAQSLWKPLFGAGTTTEVTTTALASIFGGFELEKTTTSPRTTTKTTTTMPWNSFFISETTQRTSTLSTTHWTTPPLLSTFCLSPWFSHQDSCYLIDSGTKRTMREAEIQCLESGAHLFVPSTPKEFNQIIAKAPRDSFVWIGLFKEDADSQARWQVQTAMSYKSLPWLLQRGYTDRGNGWKKNAQCAAIFNPKFGKYVFWFDCQENYNFICQKKTSGVRENVDRFF